MGCRISHGSFFCAQCFAGNWVFIPQISQSHLRIFAGTSGHESRDLLGAAAGMDIGLGRWQLNRRHANCFLVKSKNRSGPKSCRSVSQ